MEAASLHASLARSLSALFSRKCIFIIFPALRFTTAYTKPLQEITLQRLRVQHHWSIRVTCGAWHPYQGGFEHLGCRLVTVVGMTTYLTTSHNSRCWQASAPSHGSGRTVKSSQNACVFTPISLSTIRTTCSYDRLYGCRGSKLGRIHLGTLRETRGFVSRSQIFVTERQLS